MLGPINKLNAPSDTGTQTQQDASASSTPNQSAALRGPGARAPRAAMPVELKLAVSGPGNPGSLLLVIYPAHVIARCRAFMIWSDMTVIMVRTDDSGIDNTGITDEITVKITEITSIA